MVRLAACDSGSCPILGFFRKGERSVETAHFYSDSLEVTLINEPTDIFYSVDNLRSYDREYRFDAKERFTSAHGVVCETRTGKKHSCIVAAAGGATTVHTASFVIVADTGYLAIGDRICRLDLPSLSLRWAHKVDDATCFGVYHSVENNCLIVHGELEITRVELDGRIAWHAGGKDIFSEGIRVLPDHVEAIDFNREIYHMDIRTGATKIIGAAVHE